MRRTPTKSVQPATTKLTLTLTNELKDAIIKKARETFGDRRGGISIYVEMVMRNELHLSQPHVEET